MINACIKIIKNKLIIIYYKLKLNEIIKNNNKLKLNKNSFK